MLCLPVWIETISKTWEVFFGSRNCKRCSKNESSNHPRDLIPDFQGIEKHIDRIIEVAPEVVSHNIETVKRLTREVKFKLNTNEVWRF